MTVALDIIYSNEHQDDRRLDLFAPAAPNGCSILFLHGGGWSLDGGKERWHDVARHFCARGYLCASATYRRAPKHRFPAQVEDVRLAMTWLRGRAFEMGMDPGKTAAWGSSAGGHLAALLATIAPGDPLGVTDELADMRFGSDTRPNAVVAYCPAAMLPETTDLALLVHDFIGVPRTEDPLRYQQAEPLFRVAGGEPPFLLLHGDADKTLPAENHSIPLHEALLAAGCHSELHLIPNAEHGYGYGVHRDCQKLSIGYAEGFLARTLNLLLAEGNAS